MGRKVRDNHGARQGAIPGVKKSLTPPRRFVLDRIFLSQGLRLSKWEHGLKSVDFLDFQLGYTHRTMYEGQSAIVHTQAQPSS